MSDFSESKVYESLQLAFSRPPASAGRRLKSEPELSLLFEIKRAQLRRILDRFVEEGVLVRRHGSGTFLRKAIELPQAVAGDLPRINPFSAEGSEESRRKLSVSDRGLRFGVLWDFLSEGLSGTYSGIYEGLNSRCEESGHTVEIHPAAMLIKQRRSRAAILKALSAAPYDGLIVRADRDELFHLMGEASRPPALFIEVTMARKEVEPVINFGREGALRKGVKILHQEGARKIALVGWSTPGHNGEYRRAYLNAVVALGLDFASCHFLGEDQRSNRAIFEMLLGPYSEVPDAIYFVDDVALKYAAPLFKEFGFMPGKNIRVIAEADRGVALPDGFDWSVLIFNPFQVGRLAIDCLEAAIQSTGDELLSLTHEASWKPGLTHRLSV